MFNQDNIQYPTFAAYPAFNLLLEDAPEFLDKTENSIWQKWAPVILLFPIHEDNKNHGVLLRYAYQFAPEKIIESVLHLINRENSRNGHIYIIKDLDSIWDDRLVRVFVNKIRESNLSPVVMGDLLEALLRNGEEEGQALLEDFISFPLPEDESEQERVLIAAKCFLIHTPENAWPRIWKFMIRDENFGCNLMKKIAAVESSHGSRLISSLNEEQLADLFIWMENRFPHKKDPNNENGGWVSPLERIISFRDSILS